MSSPCSILTPINLYHSSLKLLVTIQSSWNMQPHMWQQIKAQRTSWGQGCFSTFVVNFLLLWSNSAPLRVTLLLLHMSLTRILNNNKLLFQTKKCWFHQTKIDYLSIIIFKDSIRVDPEKIKEVTDWPEPRDKHEIWQFLGFCNFYRQFIKGFAKVAKPLTELTDKKEWKWTQKERRAFEKLKRLMITTPILAIPNPEYKLWVKVDTSGHAIEGVLSQLQPDKS